MTFDSDIICLQEIWHHSDMLNFFREGVCRTRSNESGGGVITCFNNILRCDKNWEIAEDSLKLKLIYKNHIPIFLINVYPSPIDPLRTILNSIFALLPQYLLLYIIIIGDWNVNFNSDSSDKKSLIKVIQALHLQIFLPPESTRKEATLDFLVCGSNFNLIKTETFDSPSDHKIVSYHLNIKSTNTSVTPLIPNAILGKELTINSLKCSKNAWEFLTNYNLTVSVNSSRSKITPKNEFSSMN